jgi:hypothetical protein
MSRAVRLWILSALLIIVAAAAVFPRAMAGSDPERDALLEDLRNFERGQIGPVADDVFHHPERPGKVVRVIPWVGPDGTYAIVAVTEAGWVYRSGRDLSEWTLAGRILEGTDF